MGTTREHGLRVDLALGSVDRHKTRRGTHFHLLVERTAPEEGRHNVNSHLAQLPTEFKSLSSIFGLTPQILSSGSVYSRPLIFPRADTPVFGITARSIGSLTERVLA